MKKIVILALLFSAGSLFSYSYQTLKTDHFYIHFPEHLNKEKALQAAEWAEGAYETLRKIFPYDVAPVHIKLITDSDDANGSAITHPVNLIQIYLTEPSSESEIGYGDWLQGVIIHELTHIFEMDAVNGYSSILRTIFGKPAFPFTNPNYTTPIWFHEGMAVFNESVFTEDGRLNSTEYDTYYRRDALFYRFPDISLFSSYFTNPQYPYGSSPYIYGAGIFKEIYNTLSEKKNFTGDLAYNQAGRFYYFFNYGTENLLGEELPYTEVYQRFTQSETKRQEKNLLVLSALPFTESKVLKVPEDLNEITSLASSLYNPLLFYIEKSASQKPVLYQYNPVEKKKMEILSEKGLGDRLFVSPSGNFLYFTLFKKLNSEFYSVPYFYDIKKKKYYPVSSKLTRMTEIASSYNDSQLIGIKITEEGEKNLTLFDQNSQELKTLETKTRAYSPLFLPDGNHVLTFESMKKETTLYSFDLSTGEKKLVLSLKGKVRTPVLSGDTLYFSYDLNGVYNLYSLSLKDNKLTALSHLKTEGILPAPSLNQLYFLYLGKKNHEIHEISLLNIKSYEPETLPKISSQSIPFESYQPKKIDAPVYESYIPFYYSPIQGWMPLFQYDGTNLYTGLNLSGSDPLGNHFFSLSPYYGLSEKDYGYFLNYTYFPDDSILFFKFSASKNSTTYTNAPLLASGTSDYIQKEFENSLYSGIKVETLNFSFALGLGGIYNSWKSDSSAQYYFSFYTGSFYGPSIFLQFSNKDFYLDSIVPENGIDLYLSYTHFIDPDIQQMTAKTGLSLSLFLDSVLSLQNTLEAQLGEKLPQEYFVLSMRGYRDSSIRGYYYWMGSFEFLFPFLNINAGFSNKPFFFRSIYLNLFYDYAQVSNTGFGKMKLDDFYIAMGGELGLSMLLTYGFYLDFVVGYAYAQTSGESSYYFNFKVPFSFLSDQAGISAELQRKKILSGKY